MPRRRVDEEPEGPSPEEQGRAVGSYEDMERTEPPRDVALPDETNGGSLAERLEAGGDMSDIQHGVNRLFPKDPVVNDLMVARVAPEVFLAALHLCSINEIMQADPGRPIDVTGTYMKNYVKCSIGLDGMGRIDLAEIMGAAREEKMKKAMMNNPMAI